MPHNTNSAEHAAAYPGGAEVAGVLGAHAASTPSIEELGRAAKRPMRKRSGIGWSGGKHPVTLRRRYHETSRLFAKEGALAAKYKLLADRLAVLLADVEYLVKPEVVRLGYDSLHMYVKYCTVRTYFLHIAEGHSAVHAGELAGYAHLTSSSAVRTWARDYLRSSTQATAGDDAPEPKPPHTFSPYRVGGHVKWLLTDERLQAKVRKWIFQHAEVKGKACMDVEAFRRYLSGAWDEAKGGWAEEGPLSVRGHLSARRARRGAARRGAVECVRGQPRDDG